MYKVVRKSEAKLRQINESKSALNYITKEVSPNVSLATTKAKDYTEELTAEYDRIYFVLEGQLTLKFEEEEVVLDKYDSCFVSKGTKYEMSGTFEAVMVNQPAFGT